MTPQTIQIPAGSWQRDRTPDPGRGAFGDQCEFHRRPLYAGLYLQRRAGTGLSVREVRLRMMMLSLPMSRETPAVVSRCLLLITAPLNPREAKAPPDTSGRKWRRLRPTMKYQMLTWYFV